MRTLTVLCALATSAALLTGCGSGGGRTAETDFVQARWLESGYYLPAEPARAILGMPDEQARRDAFFQSAILLQATWAVDRDTFLWLLKKARTAQNAPDRGQN